MKKIIALLLALGMLLSLAACGSDEKAKEAAAEETVAESFAEADLEPVVNDDILVVACDAFSRNFSPFFAVTRDDAQVVNIVSQYLLQTDREGNVVLNGIDGETAAYNGTEYTYYGIANCEIVEQDDGTVDYNITLRDDVCFSDGTNLTADDVIFTMYVLCDPAYDGPSTLRTMPIVGLEAYRSGVDTMMDLMLEAGEDNTDFTHWTEDEQTDFWADLEQAGTAFAQEVVDYCMELGAEDVTSAAAMWNYTLDEGATVEDFFAAMCETHDWDMETLSEIETADSSLFELMEHHTTWMTAIETGDSADHIEGIQKTGDYTLTVTVSDAAAVSALNIPIAPMHYYGDASLYDYDNHMFGFRKGDMRQIREKSEEPMGAGPYKFHSWEDGTVALAANEFYWKGTPPIEYMLWEEAAEANKLLGVSEGDFDIADPALTTAAAELLRTSNSNGELSGDAITTHVVDHSGYGYIGICADTVNVDGASGSEASKALRKAFATLFAVHRDAAIDAYYGDFASVIQYPVSDTSWTAPTEDDADYQTAYSVGMDGSPIYTEDMTEEERYAAALEAARGFLQAAGYTFDENGAATAAPAGAELTYTFTIPAGGTGDHPSYGIVTAVQEDLASLGITLEINDLSDAAQLWDELQDGKVEMWAVAWDATANPDLYQIYHSDNTASEGTQFNCYGIRDSALDARIMDARSSDDPAVYKDCFDIVLDWGVEVPVYQRQNALVFSAARVNMDTVTPDITPYWGWMNDIHLLQMN